MLNLAVAATYIWPTLRRPHSCRIPIFLVVSFRRHSVLLTEGSALDPCGENLELTALIIIAQLRLRSGWAQGGRLSSPPDGTWTNHEALNDYTADHRMNGLLRGAGGPIMPVVRYFRIMYVYICIYIYIA